MYYPTGSTLFDGSIRHSNGTTFAGGTSSNYASGRTLASSGNLYYPANQTLINSTGDIYYPNGSYLRNGSLLYSESGSTNVDLVTMSRSFTDVNVFVNARSSAVWIGILDLKSDPSFEATMMEQRPMGATLGGANSVIEVPPSPVGLSLTSSTDTSVTVTWNSGGGNTSKYRVRSIATPSSFIPTCVNGTDTTATTFTFSNLTPSSQYAFLVCAVNTQGLMSPAAILLQTAGQPVPTPINVVAGTPGGFSIPVSWESPNSSVVSYIVKATKAPTIPTDCRGGTGIGNVLSYNVQGLEENARYYVAVCSVNSSGVQSTPVVVSQRTLPVPPPEPLNFVGSSIYPTQLSLSWQSGGGTTGSYVIQIAPSPVTPAACNQSPIQVGGTVYVATGLSASTTYNVRLCAVTLNGTLSVGNVYSATTVGVATNGLEFAGAFGSTNRSVNNVLNPATGAATCPVGYFPYKIMDTNNIDYPMSYCWRRPVSGQETAYDFGGVLGTINQIAVPNPVSGQSSCPTGYSELQVLNATGYDASFKFCMRPHQVGRSSDVLFGGAFGSVAGVPVFNPATGDQTCAPGFTKTQVYGTTSTNPKDYAIFVCHKSLATAPVDPTNLSSTGVTPATVSLAWTAAPGAAGYVIAYQTGAVAPATCAGGQTFGAVTTATISSLVPSTQYSFRVCSANAFLNTSAGIVTSATTSSAPLPPELVSLNLTTPSSSTVTLTWVSGGAAAVGYRVARADGLTPPANCAGGVNVGNVLTYSVSNLLQGNAYSFRVCSLNNFGVASTGLTRSVTTNTLVVAINSNGPAVAPFVADTYVVGGAGFSTTNAINVTGLTNPAPASVYQRSRYGNMTYTIPGLVAAQNYRVRLHFCENFFTSANQRRFRVTLNGTVALNNFDVFATTGARYKAYINESVVAANTAGQIVVQFANLVNNADVSGLEIHRIP